MFVESFAVIGIALSIAGALAPAFFARAKAKSHGKREEAASEGPQLQTGQGVLDKEKTGAFYLEVPPAHPAPRPRQPAEIKILGPTMRLGSPLLLVVMILTVVAVVFTIIWKLPQAAPPVHHPSQTAEIPPGAISSVVAFLFTTTPGLHVVLVVGLLSVVLLLRHALMSGFMQLDFAARFLTGFALVVVLFGLSALITYRHSISVSPDRAYEAVGLFFAMVAGMFVQVLAGNYTRNQKLLNVSGSQLVFPILYSPFVYYPIWGLSSSSPRLSFSLYAAFVNGYFWESVVSAVKSQAKGKPGEGQGLIVAEDPINNTQPQP